MNYLFVAFLLLIMGCSEVEKKLHETQSIDQVCPVTKKTSHILLSNNKNIPDIEKLITTTSNNSLYRNQIINFALAQLYLNPHSTNLNSYTLLFAKVNGKEFFINSIPQGQYDFSFINAVGEMAKFYNKPLAIKSRLQLIENKTNEYIYAPKSLEDYIKNNQAELFHTAALKKLYFRGAQGVREDELFQRISYLRMFSPLKRMASKHKKVQSYNSSYLFKRGNYSCSFDSKIHDAKIVILKKPVKSYNNIFAHYKDDNNYIIGATSSLPKVSSTINNILFSSEVNDNNTAVCVAKEKGHPIQFIMMNDITYNSQVLNTLINDHRNLASSQELLDTKRSLILHNPTRLISEIYGISTIRSKQAQYYGPALGKLTILELDNQLNTYLDPRNGQLTCN